MIDMKNQEIIFLNRSSFCIPTKSSSVFTLLGALVYGKLFIETLKHFPEEANDFAISFIDMVNKKDKKIIQKKINNINYLF